PAPVIDFHGTADPMIPYKGGTTWITPQAFPNVRTWTQSWALRNECAPSPVDSQATADVVRREYVHCASGASVVLYTIAGGGHTWPGGERMPEWAVGVTSRSVDATKLMWAFFTA